jgi:exopolyphosphatase/guanosine-5'-triphosphate,3'-diphosphate pyrophosphatase
MSAVAERTVAAVDLGSNSFHLIVAQTGPGGVRVVDRLRETVRLGTGLDADKRLGGEVVELALACLQRFGERLRDLPPGAVRAVGTNTLRRARNARSFLKRAQEALGHRIEVISGYEEARLIYLGVASGLAGDAQRLVIDVGGGSTELIIGAGPKPQLMESLHIGCVSMTLAHFSDGKVGRKAWRRAVLAARQELEPVQGTFRMRGWQEAIGASGSIRAVGDVARAAGWSNGAITDEVLERCEAAVLAAERLDQIDLPDLSEERRPVFAGGLAVLRAAFTALGIERMQVASGALREGLLADLLGRLEAVDERERTVTLLAQRHSVDAEQAERVARTALALLGQIAEPWGLQAPPHAKLLLWAARLHELGLVVSHSQYQKHGAYLLEHGDMAGFSRDEQSVLAALVRAQRRKFPLDAFAKLPSPWDRKAHRLAVILRSAVLLHRARSEDAVPALRCVAVGRTYRLEFPAGWLEQRPLTLADLEEEAGYLDPAGVEFGFA